MILSTISILLFFAVVYTLVRLLVLLYPKKKSARIIDLRPYEEYETPHDLDKIWVDQSKVGKCQVCGMDDLPLFDWWGDTPHEYRLGFMSETLRCIWCAELKAINEHLSTHGQRRMARR